VVRLLVNVDGYIRATQLLSSTGFERLNAACLSSFTDGRMIPTGGKDVCSIDGHQHYLAIAIAVNATCAKSEA
jgi:hypothetical protein